MYKGGVNPLEIMMNKKVQVILVDGRVYVGLLHGIDQAMNCVLSECEERVYSKENDFKCFSAGLQVIRGDTVAMMGEINLEREEELSNFNSKANALPPIFR